MLGMIFDLVGGFFQRSHERKTAEHRAERESIRAGQPERANGLKDDVALYIVCIPFLAAFIPNWQPYVIQGFAALQEMPVWYQALLPASLAAAQGINMKNKFNKKKEK